MTIPNVARLFQERTGQLPYQITFLSDKEALIEFEEGIPVVEISQEIHNTTNWGELEVNVGCVMAGKATLLNLYQGRSRHKIQSEEIRTQMKDMRREQENYQEQLVGVVQQLQDKIKEMERRSKESIPVGGIFSTPGNSYINMGGYDPPKG